MNTQVYTRYLFRCMSDKTYGKCQFRNLFSEMNQVSGSLMPERIQLVKSMYNTANVLMFMILPDLITDRLVEL